MDSVKPLDFLAAQLAEWPKARANFEALAGLQHKVVEVNGFPFRLQHNPARIASTGASVSRAAIAARPCFLCRANRPAEQRALLLVCDGKGTGEEHRYELLVNPFPIFPVHFTVALAEHRPQCLALRVADIVEVAEALEGLAVFYNGPECGASAPDHHHFQAVERCEMPMLQWMSEGRMPPYRVMYHRAGSYTEAVGWLEQMLASQDGASAEPRVNVVATATRSERGGICYELMVIPRRRHRPDFYGTGPGQALVSPASVDLCGTIVLPRPEDFNENVDAVLLRRLFEQTCM